MPLNRLFAALHLGALLIFAPAARAQALETPPKVALCITCHGPQGNPILPGFPALAGQTSRYIYLQLRDFQEGRRSNEQMSPVAKELTRDEMRAFGAYFATQKNVPQPFQPDAAKAALGKAKADETLCSMCHLGGFAGQNEIPRAAGQPFDYIVAQLRAFKARTRTNDAGNMTAVSSTLSDDDINVAQFARHSGRAPLPANAPPGAPAE